MPQTNLGSYKFSGSLAEMIDAKVDHIKASVLWGKYEAAEGNN
jgi:hypothetical protein